MESENRIGDLVETLRTLAEEEGRLPSERSLSEQLGVHRHVLRQGLQVLRESGGLQPARSRSSSGKHFKMLGIIKDTSPVEVWEARLSIEPQIARVAALKATPKEIRAIHDAHRAANPKIFTPESDNDFHRKVAAASRNTLWIIFIDLLTELTLTESFQMQLPPFTSVTGFEHHEEILQAIAARDAMAAEKAMHAHLSAIQRWVMGLPASAISRRDS
jgi:DNA-binding FadR family transcriptional regulator